MNSQHNELSAVSSVVASKMVTCVQSAVGDDIREDIFSRGLRTQNSTPMRIWDLLNTGLYSALGTADCMIVSTKRGCWEMVITYERSSGYIYTFMREKRYDQLHKQIRKRGHMHYVDALVRHLNPDLCAPIEQLSLFEVHFTDEEMLSEIVQKLLTDLVESGVIIKRHVLVLFNSSAYELLSIRAVMIDRNLNIVEQEDWSQFISAEESVIAEHTEDTDSPFNKPSRGLNLTSKALSRKKAAPMRKNEVVQKNGE